MDISALKKQEKFANTVSFYSTLSCCLCVGLCFLLLYNNNLVNAIFLTSTLITVAARVLEKKIDRFSNISKIIYMIVFSIAPPAVFYLLEKAGSFGLPSIAFSFTYIFVANMYYNFNQVQQYLFIPLQYLYSKMNFSQVPVRISLRGYRLE